MHKGNNILFKQIYNLNQIDNSQKYHEIIYLILIVDKRDITANKIHLNNNELIGVISWML
jgi:hypothetical protein